MTKPLQQGHADGLCGLYCVLNFLTPLAEWKAEDPKIAMEYVLEAVQAEGLLNPRWITGGFRSAELKGIVNRIFDRWWMPYQAYFLCEVARLESEKVFELHRRILEAGGSVIGGSDLRTHWLLFTMFEGEARIIDSANPDRPSRPFNGHSKALCSEDSIVLLPKNRPSVEIGS